MLLEEEGKLSLDDDVRKYIPELPDYGHTIGLRHLIHHICGLKDKLTLWEISGRT
ncbi:CubicO group peptidase (beta-lactamase class C family) [Catalinimonas alkaloidigena]|nr:CubicO group peptidase (beta-lactamase class C family) [Catalinimonas alkaloidigena]